MAVQPRHLRCLLALLDRGAAVPRWWRNRTTARRAVFRLVARPPHGPRRQFRYVPLQIVVGRDADAWPVPGSRRKSPRLRTTHGIGGRRYSAGAPWIRFPLLSPSKPIAPGFSSRPSETAPGVVDGGLPPGRPGQLGRRQVNSSRRRPGVFQRQGIRPARSGPQDARPAQGAHGPARTRTII